MPNKKNELPIITADQLRVGIYVDLELGWMDHPFTFSHFKIKDDAQIAEIRKLGLKKVRWDPDKSDTAPAEKESGSEKQETSTYIAVPADIPEPGNSGEKSFAEIRSRLNAVEKAFTETSSATESIIGKISSSPTEAVQETAALIDSMTGAMNNAKDLAVHMVSSNKVKQSIHSHSVNITVLATAFAQTLNLSEEQKSTIGIGCMLHDVGLGKLPDRFVRNNGPLTKQELISRKHHCEYGLQMAEKMNLSGSVMDIIVMHHEYYDGSGYPAGLTGDDIPYEVQLVSMVNFYERLCNPVNMQEATTSHDALSVLYRKHKKQFAPDLLKRFIHFMGVYPPGSIVNLSDNRVGIVLKVYADSPMRPMVMIYDPEVPRNEAVILELRENKDINITKAINPSLLPNTISDYLSPQDRTNYYFDSE